MKKPAETLERQPAERPFEVRDFRFEVKLEDLTEDGQFEGYAAVFGNEDFYGDVIEPGAFKKSIRETKGQVPILWQHWTDEVIGVSLELEEDENGLHTRGQLVLATQRGLEAYELLKAKALKGLSIGFQTVKSLVDNDTGKRRLKEIKLWEYSLATFPANSLALVGSVKSSELARLAATLRELREVHPDVVRALLSDAEPQEHSAEEAAIEKREPALATLRDLFSQEKENQNG
jgi:hypothetical protein